jgi:hypothetical protein
MERMNSAIIQYLAKIATNRFGYTLGGPFEGCLFDKAGNSVDPLELIGRLADVAEAAKNYIDVYRGAETRQAIDLFNAVLALGGATNSHL